MNPYVKLGMGVSAVALIALGTVYSGNPKAALMAYIAGIATAIGTYLGGLFQEKPDFKAPVLLVGVLGLAMAGCTAGAQQSLAALEAAQGDPAAQVQIIKEWKRNDLLAATARATAAGDKIGALCYSTLAKYVDSTDATLGTALQFAGVWDAFEAARIGVKAGTSGSLADNPVLQDLQIGCAPLIGDIRLTLIRLGIMGGAVIMK